MYKQKLFLIKYHEKLRNIPAPGNGCHTFLLSVANAGVSAHVPDQEIFEDIKNNIPAGNRIVKDREIWDAIKKASHSAVEYLGTSNPTTNIPRILPDYLKQLINRGQGTKEADLTAKSPIKIPDDYTTHSILLLDNLYNTTDNVFIGDKYGKLPKTVKQWKETLSTQGAGTFPHITPNPLSGKQEQSYSGNLSYRCDACIAQFKYAVIEFDNLTRDEQLAFWVAIPLPIVTLIDTAGKSIHAWIKVSGITTLSDWNSLIKNKLYRQRLASLGVDMACSNASRLSRLPGHLRAEKQRFQQLLYINPDPISTAIRSL